MAELRPEVAEAVLRLRSRLIAGKLSAAQLDEELAWRKLIDSELQRLTDENARLLYERDESRAEAADMRVSLNDRIAFSDECIAKLRQAEAERDALRKRIEDAPVGVFDLCYNGHEPGFLGFPNAIENLPKGSMLGQRVRLVPVTEPQSKTPTCEGERFGS